MTATIKITSASLSDVGKARELNEDSCYTGERVFAVADGLGGHQAGEVASSIAIASIETLDREPPASPGDGLVAAVHRANREVFERAHHESEHRGMATTITAVVIDGAHAYLAHVGDSRCYLLRDGAISQITEDHTLVARMVEEGKLTPQQAETHPQRSVVTRALGAGPEVDVDTLQIELYGGDRLLLCSDGLTATLSDDEIRELAVKRTELEPICRSLVDEANARGGPDNITVVLVAIEGPRNRPSEPVPEIKRPASGLASTPKPEPARGRRIPVRAIVWLLVAAILVAGAIIAERTWVSRSWYLGVESDHVAIFQGLPTDAPGVKLHHVAERTDITLAQVAPFYRPRLNEGIRVDDLAAARALVAKIPRATPTPSASPTPRGSPTP